MSIVNEYEFKKCIDRYNGDRHSIKFTCRDQFMVMSLAQFTDRPGLRAGLTTYLMVKFLHLKSAPIVNCLGRKVTEDIIDDIVLKYECSYLSVFSRLRHWM